MQKYKTFFKLQNVFNIILMYNLQHQRIEEIN